MGYVGMDILFSEKDAAYYFISANQYDAWAAEKSIMTALPFAQRSRRVRWKNSHGARVLFCRYIFGLPKPDRNCNKNRSCQAILTVSVIDNEIHISGQPFIDTVDWHRYSLTDNLFSDQRIKAPERYEGTPLPVEFMKRRYR